MKDPESTASNESMTGRRNDAYAGWQRLFAESLAAQANLVKGLTEVSIESGLALQRQYAALAESWMRSAAPAGGARIPPAPEPTAASATGDQARANVAGSSGTSGEPADSEKPDTPEEPAAESPTPGAPRRTRPQETTSEPEGEAVVAGASAASERASADREQPTSGAEPAAASADVEQLEAIEPDDAEQLRSADVHTVGQLAAASPEEVAAETELDRRQVRVFIVRARRARRW